MDNSKYEKMMMEADLRLFNNNETDIKQKKISKHERKLLNGRNNRKKSKRKKRIKPNKRK